LTVGEGYDIYYTLDGTVPTVKSEKYVAAISLGADFCDTNYTLRAVGYKNGKYTDVVKYNYSLNLKHNVLLGIIPTFNETNTTVGLIEGNGLVTDPSQLAMTTDNVYGNFNGLYIDPGEWYNYDLGSEFSINELTICVYHNWTTICNLKIQLSTTADFSSNVYNVVFSNGGMGTNYTFANGSVGFKFNFAPFTARYIRASNTGNSASQSRICEIQAFEGTALICRLCRDSRASSTTSIMIMPMSQSKTQIRIRAMCK
jgi:hypothetical protein